MKDRNSFRGLGITKDFAQKFKSSMFYTSIYQNHKDEIIIGVRDGYICMYYNCDCIAKIEPAEILKAKIDPYYTDNKYSVLTEEQMVALYPLIKAKSDARNKNEKQAQQMLFVQNNNNMSSKWFCVDLEFTKSLCGKEKAEDWRFDIIAISKCQPFKIALIELKYGAGAMKEPSGIRTHIKDFYSFHTQDQHSEFNYQELKKEVISMVTTLKELGVEVPKELNDVTENKMTDKPEYVILTLNNNPVCEGGSTPKQTMSGYLFSDQKWGSRRVSGLVKNEGDYYKLINNDDTFIPQFLFSEETLPNICISDIINDDSYEKETVAINFPKQ